MGGSADAVVPQFVGGRLVQARELRGMTQSELAARISRPSPEGVTPLTRAAIAHYEGGLAAPSSAVLVQLQVALGVEPGFFARRTKGETLPASFRSLRSAPAIERRRARQVAQLVQDVVDVLSAAVRLPQWQPLQDLTAGMVPEEAAAITRNAWGVPPGPIPDVVRALERAGCVCAVTSCTAPEVDAFSVPFQPTPVVMLSAVKGKRDRSRFDAAHEAGHLLLHRDSPKDVKVQESEAHAFAAAFLMPADQICQELPGNVDWPLLAELKQRWGVSLGSLVKRCLDLGKIDKAQYTSAMKYMSMRGWRKQEPVDLGPCEEPRLLREAMKAAKLGVPGIAAALRLPAADLEELLGESIDSRPTVIL